MLFVEWLSLPLQIQATFVITNWGRVITNQGNFYKSWQLSQIGAPNVLYAINEFNFTADSVKSVATIDLQKIRSE